MSNDPPMAPVPPPLSPFSRLAPTITEDLRQLKASWFWFVLLGLGLMVLGLAAISYAPYVSKAFMWVFGVLLLLAGALTTGAAFFTGCWGGFFLTLLMGVLQLITGIVCVRHPADAAIVYTILLAMFLLVGGLFRVFAAATTPFRGRGWVLAHGLITLILGVLILAQMPEAGLLILGLFIGIDLIFSGATYLVLGLQVRNLPL